MTRSHVFRIAGLALLLMAANATAGTKVLDKTTSGTPTIQSMETIRFGPGGVLFIGDGKGAQVIAVEVPGEEGKAGFKEAIEKIDKQIADKLGAPVKGIEVVDLAVHPVSHIAFVLVRKQADRKTLLLTIDGSGKIGEFSLENVKYARVSLPLPNMSDLTTLTDLAWAGDRLLVAGLAKEKFASKIFSIPGPISHDAKASVFSTETYHVAHRRWETGAPMTVLMPYEEGGKKYLTGSFACTPVVKYPLDDLKPGDKVKGISMIEMGNGNRPRKMFSYEKDGKSYVLMNTFRMDFAHRSKPVGPSPYWTVRFERDLLNGSDEGKVNEKAQWRIDKDFKPLTDRIKVVEPFHGVIRMDRLGDDRALTFKEDGKGGLTLVALALP
jgi:hypothetical protein